MRTLLHTINAQSTSDGAGVKMHRIAGSEVNTLIDPFLMIDEMNSDNKSDYMGGFPEHPHRGFDLISYMKAGRLRHRDHLGNEGVLEAGDVQWMTAGRGVLHSEMPEQEEGLHHSFQVWLNLPADEKMKPAAYQDIPSADIAEAKLVGGGLVRVIAGRVELGREVLNGPMPVFTTQPVFLDVALNQHESVELVFNQDYPALVYIYQGSINKNLAQRQLGIFSKGERLQLTADEFGAGLLVFSGRPLEEPIVQYGPFVMNTQEEIEQAIDDYKNNNLL